MNIKPDEKTYAIRFKYTNWNPEIHFWFITHKPSYLFYHITGTHDCIYAFKDEEDAIAFKLRFPESCRSAND